MDQVVAFVPGLVALAFAAVFAASAFSRAKAFAPKSRVDLALVGLDAVAALVFARALTPWAAVSPPLWLLPVAVVAAGVFGAVLRWRQLPGTRPGTARWRTVVSIAGHAAVYAVVVLLFAT